MRTPEYHYYEKLLPVFSQSGRKKDRFSDPVKFASLIFQAILPELAHII